MGEGIKVQRKLKRRKKRQVLPPEELEIPLRTRFVYRDPSDVPGFEPDPKADSAIDARLQKIDQYHRRAQVESKNLYLA